MQRIRVNGVGLHHQLIGAGEPLVLVHGSWTDADSWRFVVPELARTHQVLTYDRRGHSRSERPTEQGSRRQDEDDLVALIEALDLAPVHLVGSSFGGAVALSVACRRPDLVRDVAVHEPALPSVLDDEETAPVRATLGTVVAELVAGEVEAGTRRFMEEVALGPGSWSLLPEEARAVYVGNAPTFVDEMRDPAWDRIDVASLGGLAAPALLSDGDQSQGWLRAIPRAVAARIPGARRHTFAGAGHAPHLTHPDQFVSVIRSFTLAAAGTASASG